MPVSYAGIVQEHRAVRTAAGVFDVSHMGEFEVRGKDAARYVDRLVTDLRPKRGREHLFGKKQPPLPKSTFERLLEPPPVNDGANP